MSDGTLGKATLELTADTTGLDRGQVAVERMDNSLDALAEIARITEEALGSVKMGAGQSAESRASAQGILSGVRGIGEEAFAAARELDNVKLRAPQAAETDIVGDSIDRKLDEIKRNAEETRLALDRVKLSGSAGPGSASGLGGLGGALGSVGIGAAALTAPTIGSAGLGLLATIPTVVAGATGALGTLALAFDGVGKAIGGDKKAFDGLGQSAQQFVLTVRSLQDWFDKLRQTAGQNLFPGLTEGLKSALSPGTVSAITTAVAEFGKAIGQAGAAWGKYFGSGEFQSIFGPLMKAGAANIKGLTSAAISLFDALGVVGRAAIPLTTWLTNSAAAGARWVDAFVHAKDASGQLGASLDEARKSLQLVGGLVESLGKVVIALGSALLPVSQVAVKDLTNGLTALAGWIDRNKVAIRDIVGGALKDLVAAVKLVSGAVSAFYNNMKGTLGSKNSEIVAGIVAIGVALTIALGPESLPIAGAILAVGEIARHWSAIKTWFGDFGQFMVSTFSAAWTGIKGIFDLGIYGVLIELRLLVAGLKDGLGWIPGIGGKIKAALNDVSGFIDSFRTNGLKDLATAGDEMGSAWGDAFKKPATGAVTSSWANLTTGWSTDGLKSVAAGGTAMGTSWGEAFTTATGAAITTAWSQVSAFNAYSISSLKNPFTTPTNKSGTKDLGTPGKIGANQGLLQGPPPNTTLPKKLQDAIDAAQAGHGDLDKANAAAYAYYEQLLKKNPTDKQAIYSAETPYAPQTTGGSVFTTPPPFTTNLGPKPKKAPVIPPMASHAEQLASRNASKAKSLGNVGETAKRYLDLELADLNTATKLLKTKYESATGAARTELFAALTSVRNKITTVRTELKKTITSDRAAELQFAVDQAKDAVASAAVGSTAYKKAITAEEAALRAQIEYLDARAKNSKLSLAARTSAINKETADKKALSALLKPLTAAAGDANEAQFLSDFAAITENDASNATPATGATDTHLYEIKHELRQQTPLLKAGLKKAKFPSSGFALSTPSAVTG